ncbi:M20 family metallopeptidase [Lichenibacterium ramalinae]|uniref:M20 peptidase family dipeptidase n=1 Tax=Lichenibacterium ramalinae TaxID=2316527 RepID=A0A4Q2RFP8_9HYPH|nr:M20 family metallopeptidase [Lichenibacterium ramalinae]RYB06109.1 M20 peptidase family dipeptidase [Lichenibacterium ramalinae]
MDGRAEAIAAAVAAYDDGTFLAVLRRRVAMPTVSQGAADLAALRAYLDDEMAPSLAGLGFASEVYANPHEGFGPLLVAERHEGADLPTVLIYGHGDTVPGQDAAWRPGLVPHAVTVEGDRLYGRGTADNKGQHTIGLLALGCVAAARGGRLGFNAKVLIETGEEAGSPGLDAFCAAHRAELAADVLIASDGPRLAADRPTLFLGSRGAFNIDLSVTSRDRAHHSGNWGGLLRNPATVLSAAIASMVDARGRILVEALRPPPIPPGVRAALADLAVGGGPDDPAIDADWGEPGLSDAERVFGWNSLEVLALLAGTPEAPQNAIPAWARATLQLRFVVGTDWRGVVPALRRHLDGFGLGRVAVQPARGDVLGATRLDPADPWVAWALASLAATTGRPPALLPNLGGSLPNDVFADTLGLPTLWVPHSHGACNQHAPNEFLLGPIAREGLAIMAGLFWDLGEGGGAVLARRRAG